MGPGFVAVQVPGGSGAFPGPAWVSGPAAPKNGGMFVLLNLAVGGTVGAPSPGARFPAELLVDYVRVSPPDSALVLCRPPGIAGARPSSVQAAAWRRTQDGGWPASAAIACQVQPADRRRVR